MNTTNRQREPFDENFFMYRNVIQLRGEITDTLANNVVSAMHYLMFCFKEEKIPRDKREIDLWIMNSPGGSVSAGMAIYDTMNIIDCDVRTTCVGRAASMAAFLLSSGTKGKRIALPNSEILIHQPLGGTQGQASDICIYAEHIKRTKEKLNGILALNTGKPIEQIAIDTDRDNCMSASEALAYGLIDHIVSCSPKAYANAI